MLNRIPRSDSDPVWRNFMQATGMFFKRRVQDDREPAGRREDVLLAKLEPADRAALTRSGRLPRD